MTPPPSRLRVAAVQLEGVIGEVATNLDRCEQLIAEALAGGAQLIALPEFFTSTIAHDRRVHAAVLPPENPALDLLRRTALANRVWIGGSMLVADGDEIFNRYHFVEPDGRVHRHDKDLPTMWENACYGPGRDPALIRGRWQTGLGEVGAAVCWELIRTRTVQRLRGVALAVTGTHWWTIPDNWGGASRALAGLGETNRRLSEQAPAEFARHLGAPVLQASHCGRFHSAFPLLPHLPFNAPYDTRFVGHSQIVDAEGRVLAARPQTQGPGVVLAEIAPGARAPATPLEGHRAERFWLPQLPMAVRAYWHQQNHCGRHYYETQGRAAGLAAAHAVSPPRALR